ncbi:hypothetical protein BDN70DRAFT_933486 [Pholiota conissans]|uniref:C2H2-type domain-containing protein n=1 Tax=Pholiota conissans TaxID=109636 RepID=A0A9P6CZD6_9AGAR|nr:hypothetical protein BDN70DRAFT_933486 [Pholiota conissans]
MSELLQLENDVASWINAGFKDLDTLETVFPSPDVTHPDLLMRDLFDENFNPRLPPLESAATGGMPTPTPPSVPVADDFPDFGDEGIQLFQEEENSDYSPAPSTPDSSQDSVASSSTTESNKRGRSPNDAFDARPRKTKLSKSLTNPGKYTRLYPCPKCPHYAASSKKDFERHMLSLAHQPPSFRCDICQRPFTRDDAVKRHKDHIHGKK